MGPLLALAFSMKGVLCHLPASDMFDGEEVYLIASRPQNRRLEAELP